GVGRVGGETPAQFTFGGALEEDFGDRRAGLADPRHAGRVHAAQGARVVLRPDGQAGIESFGDQFADGRDVVQLGLAGVREENFIRAGGWQS
ncbi:MAG: hypothetical protein ABIL11_06670, partial [Chloroflexota bacterium]